MNIHVWNVVGLQGLESVAAARSRLVRCCSGGDRYIKRKPILKAHAEPAQPEAQQTIKEIFS